MGIARAGFHGTLGQPSAQVIDGSLKFDQSKKTYLKRTPGSAGNRRTWTYSAWIKRTDFPSAERGLFSTFGSAHPTTALKFGSSHVLEFLDYQGGYICQKITNQVFRDTGWYHIVIVIDTTLSTAEDRYKLYVNGERVTSFGTNTNISTQNQQLDWNSATEHNLFMHGNLSTPYDGLGSQTYFIDGQALGPEYFGFTDPLTNIWKPKKYDSFNNPNNGTTWSNLTTASTGAFEGSLPKTNLFDGIASNANRANLNTVGASIDIDFSSNPINVKNTISIWSGKANLSYSINGGAYVNYSDAAEAYKDIPFTGTLTSLSLKKSDEGAGASAIKIDGYVLLDGATDNSFYLPFDGNSPIGQDKSGQGNDYTPVNFGGSVALDNPQVSGAKPILNTLPGGTQAGVGIFGSKENVGYAVTVFNDGGGNKYYIDGVQAPTLSNLVRGATYTFDTSDSTVSSHPFVFGSTAEGNNFARGANYGSISAGTAGAATTITIPYDAPETLYYHCSSHSGMGGSIVGIHTDETKADQYASNCVFALPIISDKEDVSASIACTMSNASITNSGVDFVYTYSNFYGASGDFTGASSDALYTGDDDTKFKMEEEDFTVECWVYSTSSSGTQNVCQIYGNSGSKYYGIYWNGSSLRFYVTGTGGPGDVSAGDMVFGKSRWYHLALVRNGSTLKGYVDGVEVASNSITSDIDETGYQAYVGRHSPANNGFTGYIQDFRVYKGVAKYTSDFVVPSPSPDILPDTPSGVSGGSKLAKITDGAVSFDGTNDYLTIADSDDFNLGSGAFTIEGFCYLRSSNAQQFLVGMWTGNQLSYAVQTSNDANRYLRFLISDDGTGVDFDKVSTGSLRLNGWSHFAVTRSGNTFYLFVDGILVGTQSGSQTLHNSTGTLAIGARNDGTQDLNGIISNVRIVKGTALYTSRFAPPTAPLTNVTNTKLLCCQDLTEFKNGAQPILNTNATGITTTSGTRVDPYASSLVFALPFNGSNGGTTFTDVHATIKGSGSAKSVEVTGNTQTSTTQSKYYGSSGYFDGTGDYLTLLDSSDFAFGSGDFTIEAWIYITDLSGSRTISGQANSGGGGSSYGHFLEVLSDGRVNGGGYNPGDNYINVTTTTADALVINRWYHIAMVRNGNDLNLHINGDIKATSSVSGKSFTDSSNSFAIGRPGEYNGYYMYGYIQDYRVYKGAAKYTSSFNVTAPSVEPTAAVSPSSIIAAGNAAATNFNPFNTDINTVRGQETGYATLNPLSKSSNTTFTLSDGNLRFNAEDVGAEATLRASTGKFYFETELIDWNSGGHYVCSLGAGRVPEKGGSGGSGNSKYYPAYTGYNFASGVRIGTYGSNQGIFSLGTQTLTKNSGWALGDMIGVAVDCDRKKLQIYHNGVKLGDECDLPLGESEYSFYAFPQGASGDSSEIYLNFGQKPFKFPPPDGFQPLNNANTRPVKVISRSDQYVGIATWTGDGTNNRVIQAPIDADFAWIKFRNQAYSHSLYDTVRGNNKRLVSNSTGTEGTVSFSFLQNKNIQISGASDTSQNDNNEPLIGWFWKAGGNKNTFNVDNVGYANASDVNMNTGSLTSSYYNTSHSISGNITTTDITFVSGKELSKWFDGQRDTKCEPSASGTMDFSGISALQNFTGTLQFAVTAYSPNASMKFVVNGIHTFDSTMFPGDTGESDYFPAKTKWITIPVTSLQTVEFTSVSARSTQFWGMFLDGKQLVDSTATPDSLPSIAPDKVSVGTRQGFSIIKYSGDSQGGDGRIPHGLTQEPDFIIFKSLDASDNWAIYHSSMGRKYAEFTTSSFAGGNPQNRWSSLPTDKVIYLGSDTNINTKNHIMYVWHNVPGLQKFGTYEGNGSTDGPFVELGFKPALIIIKNADSSGTSRNWAFVDSTRSYANVANHTLSANLNSAESAYGSGASVFGANNKIDLLSNGFKPRENAIFHNTSGETYVYAAWAEAPSIDLYGGGANAR